jgi:antitoxin CptB
MDEARVNRARFRAWRRGFREADLILGPFADSRAADMDPQQLDRFESLLAQPDHDLYAWILEQATAPLEFDNDVMAELRNFVRNERSALAQGG